MILPVKTITTPEVLVMTLEAVADSIDAEAIPELYTQQVKNTLNRLQECLEKGIKDRRSRTSAEEPKSGFIAVADSKLPVTLFQHRPGNFVIQSSIWIREDEKITLEFSEAEDEQRSIYVCNVNQCRAGLRSSDDQSTHYLVAESVSRLA